MRRRIMHGLVGPAALLAASLLAIPSVTPLSTPAAAQARIAVSSEFRLALEPYGEFRSHPRWGVVWIPADVGPDWRPYTVGHWVYSDEFGWYWISDDSEAQWGWITFHYGRWVHDRQVGWMWIPGSQWGPAFVDWRRGHDYIGWAPMPPDELIVEMRDDPIYWGFVPAREILAPRLASVIFPVRESEVFIRQTVIENRAVFVRERNFAVNPGISPAIVAAAVGRPVRTFQVRPVVLAGTANIAGATTVQANQLRTNRTSVVRQATTVQQTSNTIRPARNMPPPLPLARGANGRLGDNPPRAARGAIGTTGAAPAPMSPPAAQSTRPAEQRGPNAIPPQQSPAAQTRPGAPSVTTGQGAPQPSPQPNLRDERRGQGAQQRERGGVQNLPRTPSGTTGQAPSAAQPSLSGERRAPGPQRERGGAQVSPAPQSPALRGPGQRSGTTGAAPSTPTLDQEPRRAAPGQQNRAAPSERVTPQAMPREHVAPPAAARPQAPPPQMPAARAPTPQAPAARAPQPPPSVPAARAPQPPSSAPAAQAPRAAPSSTTGAAPHGGGGQREQHR